MKKSVSEKLKKLSLRQKEIADLLSQPDVTSDIEQYTKLNREYSEIAPVVEANSKYIQALNDLETAKLMLEDPEMREFAVLELESAKSKIELLEEELQKLLLPKDPNDSKNIYLEIRAGTGAYN